MSLLDLFWKSNILVQTNIYILIGFSIVSWSIIFYRIPTLKIIQYKSRMFEEKFWSGVELSRLYQDISVHRNQLIGAERIFYVGFKEFSRLYNMKHCVPDTITDRTLHVMHNTINLELEKLENYIPLIGTIGTISPFFGLFGTVLGIIHVFLELGKITTNQMVHIQIIAPGIAESLISTAIGLFVSIPAVMAFNYLRVQINNIDHNYNNFIEEFIAILYHQVFLNLESELNQNNQK